MIRLDWQRSVLAPATVSCLWTSLAKSLAPRQKLISFTKVAFPHVAPYTAVFRGLVKDPQELSPFAYYFVAFARGRTEIALFMFGFADQLSKATVAQLSRRLGSRIKA